MLKGFGMNVVQKVLIRSAGQSTMLQCRAPQSTRSLTILTRMSPNSAKMSPTCFGLPLVDRCIDMELVKFRQMSTLDVDEDTISTGPLHSRMRGGKDGSRSSSLSVYNGFIDKQVAVVKSPASDFCFVPVPGNRVDPTRKEHLYRYHGHWVDGVPDGHGVLTFPNGNIFEGEMNGGKCEGYGVEKRSNGSVRYEGYWVDNKPGGMGKMNYSNGTVYIGEFVDGKREGFGRMVDEDNTVYLGDWKDNLMHGRGVVDDAQDGTRALVTYHKGEIRNVMDLEAGEVVEGLNDTVIVAFEQSLARGQRPANSKSAVGQNKRSKVRATTTTTTTTTTAATTVTSTSAASAAGDTRADEIYHNDDHHHPDDQQDPIDEKFFEEPEVNPAKLHGYLSHRIPVHKTDYSGHRFRPIKKHHLRDFLPEKLHHYQGDWENGSPNGQGTLTYPNGHIYTGEFVDGHACGYGTERLPDGRARYEGQWQSNYPHGVGRMQFFVGAEDGVYTGTFERGYRVGVGRMVPSKGDTYIGEFSKNVKHGQGVLINAAGVKRAVMYSNGKRTREDAPHTHMSADDAKWAKQLAEYDELLKDCEIPAVPAVTVVDKGKGEEWIGAQAVLDAIAKRTGTAAPTAAAAGADKKSGEKKVKERWSEERKEAARKAREAGLLPQYNLAPPKKKRVKGVDADTAVAAAVAEETQTGSEDITTPADSTSTATTSVPTTAAAKVGKPKPSTAKTRREAAATAASAAEQDGDQSESTEKPKTRSKAPVADVSEAAGTKKASRKQEEASKAKKSASTTGKTTKASKEDDGDIAAAKTGTPRVTKKAGKKAASAAASAEDAADQSAPERKGTADMFPVPAPRTVPASINYVDGPPADNKAVVAAVLTYGDGTVYAGSVRNGLRHGEGVTKNAEGKVVHSGMWRYDRMMLGRVKRVEE